MDSRLHTEAPGSRAGPPVDSPQRRQDGSHFSQGVSPSASMHSMSSGLAAAPWAGSGSGGVPGGSPGGAAGGAAGGISGLPGDRRSVGVGQVPPPHGAPVDTTHHSYQDQEVLRDASNRDSIMNPSKRTSSIGAVDSHSRNPSTGHPAKNEDYGSAFGGGRSYGSNSPASASTETFGIPGGLEQSHARNESGVLPQQGGGAALGGGVPVDTNPYGVDLVIPYDISGDKTHAAEIEIGYERLTDALASAGLRVATRPARGKAKGQEEVWVFVGASDDKVKELIEREHIVDVSHGLRTAESSAANPSDRIRLVYDLLTASKLQHGLGITPGEGDWSRVKSIAALHDDERDKAWVERWTVASWKTGLLSGLSNVDQAALGRDQPPAVRLYFNYLVFYTRALGPLAAISLVFWLFTSADSYPPAYAFILAIFSTVFVACWRIRERKLAVRWGLRGVEQVVGLMRPQYVLSHRLTTLSETHRRADAQRDAKVVMSVPIIMGCGLLLGGVLMGIFFLEAFVGHLWDGPGKQIVPLIPTALFSGLVPQIVALFTALARRLVAWENHPTYTSATRSLTAKTFALNATVAFLGLYLTAYLYLPFGPYLMSYIHTLLAARKGKDVSVNVKTESVNPAATNRSFPGAHRDKINASRLKSQVFAYTVTNQVINTFLEVGLPFILRYVNDLRAGKTSVKGIFKNGEKQEAQEQFVNPEDRFLNKVQHELELPEYNIFVDYAEMVQQFGYVVIWAIVWPLAPVFALVNNYFELRSDALKICQHVRRPIGPRVESIGTWLDTLSIISWQGAWTSATLIALFRPSPDRVLPTAAKYLASFDAMPAYSTIWGTLVRVALVALAASHGWFVLNALVSSVCEKLFWRGSPEQRIVDGAGALNTDRMENELSRLNNAAGRDPLAGKGFWNGAADGQAAILQVSKTQ